MNWWLVVVVVFFFKKGVGMEIPQYIQEIMAVDFTLAGQVCASIFSERVVREIDASMLKKRNNIANPQSYFFSAGHRICKQRNILPDYELARSLHQHFGTNDEMPLLKSLGKNPNPLMLAVPKQLLNQGKMDLTPTTRKPLPTGKPKNFLCPCHYRRKFNPDYVCYGVWCAQQELENMAAFLEPEPINP